MSLTIKDFFPGSIAYFNVEVLKTSDQMAMTGYAAEVVDNGTSRDGPFVCVEAHEDGRSTWSPITNRWKKERLRILREWVEAGYGKLGSGESYLQDGARTFTGPNIEFIRASAGEVPFNDGKRPHLTKDGAAAVAAEVHNQRTRAATVEQAQPQVAPTAPPADVG